MSKTDAELMSVTSECVNGFDIANIWIVFDYYEIFTRRILFEFSKMDCWRVNDDSILSFDIIHSSVFYLLRVDFFVANAKRILDSYRPTGIHRANVVAIF